MQVLGLRALGIKALALTSLTPKEQITGMYQQMENDHDVRLVYGACHHDPKAALSCICLHVLLASPAALPCQSS